MGRGYILAVKMDFEKILGGEESGDLRPELIRTKHAIEFFSLVFLALIC